MLFFKQKLWKLLSTDNKDTLPGVFRVLSSVKGTSQPWFSSVLVHIFACLHYDGIDTGPLCLQLPFHTIVVNKIVLTGVTLIKYIQLHKAIDLLNANGINNAVIHVTRDTKEDVLASWLLSRPRTYTVHILETNCQIIKSMGLYFTEI